MEKKNEEEKLKNEIRILKKNLMKYEEDNTYLPLLKDKIQYEKDE